MSDDESDNAEPTQKVVYGLEEMREIYEKRDAILIAVDFEGHCNQTEYVKMTSMREEQHWKVRKWEFETPNNLTEVGLSVLDLRTVQAIPPGPRGLNHFQKIEHYHWRIEENLHVGRTPVCWVCRYHRSGWDKFLFGSSEWVSITEVAVEMNRFLDRMSKKDCVGDEIRDIVFVTFDSWMEREVSYDLKFNIFSILNAKQLDIQKSQLGAQWSSNSSKGTRRRDDIRHQRPKLEEFLASIGFKVHELHNGGNDTAIELRALIAILNFTPFEWQHFGKDYRSLTFEPTGYEPRIFSNADAAWPAQPENVNELLPPWVSNTLRGFTVFRHYLLFLPKTHQDYPRCSICTNQGHFASECKWWEACDWCRSKGHVFRHCTASDLSELDWMQESFEFYCQFCNKETDHTNRPGCPTCEFCNGRGYEACDCPEPSGREYWASPKCEFCWKRGHALDGCLEEGAQEYRSILCDYCNGRSHTVIDGYENGTESEEDYYYYAEVEASATDNADVETLDEDEEGHDTVVNEDEAQDTVVDAEE